MISIHPLILTCSKKLKDRTLLLIGTILQLAGLVWLLVTLGGAKPEKSKRSMHLVFFCVGVIVLVVGMPFIFVCTPSLQSKFTTERTQVR